MYECWRCRTTALWMEGFFKLLADVMPRCMVVISFFIWV